MADFDESKLFWDMTQLMSDSTLLLPLNEAFKGSTVVRGGSIIWETGNHILWEDSDSIRWDDIPD